MMKKLSLFLAIFAIFFPSKVFCWGPLTHFHINKETSNLSNLFNTAGMAPDAFIPDIKHGWFDVAHSPGLVTSETLVYKFQKYPYVNRPNFAYILGKVAKNKDQHGIEI